MVARGGGHQKRFFRRERRRRSRPPRRSWEVGMATTGTDAGNESSRARNVFLKKNKLIFCSWEKKLIKQE